MEINNTDCCNIQTIQEVSNLQDHSFLLLVLALLTLAILFTVRPQKYGSRDNPLVTYTYYKRSFTLQMVARCCRLLLGKFGHREGVTPLKTSLCLPFKLWVTAATCLQTKQLEGVFLSSTICLFVAKKL